MSHASRTPVDVDEGWRRRPDRSPQRFSRVFGVFGAVDRRAGFWQAPAFLCFVALGAGVESAVAQPYPTAPANPVEIRTLAEENRPAAALVRQAETALAARYLEKASELYTEAHLAAPRSGFISRRRCEILTTLGRKDAALEACNRALQDGGNVVDLRVTVAALMSGPGRPAVDAVINASMMADGAQRQLPGMPWGYAAWVDIARRLEDQEMMRMNLTALQRFAPDHDETRRASALAPRSVRWLKTAGWASLLLIGFIALLRIRSRSARRARLRPEPQVALLLVAVWVCGVAPTVARGAEPPDPVIAAPPADGLSAFPIDRDDPERSMPSPEQANSNPVQFGYWLMDMASQAEEAEKQGDWRRAIRYYRTLARAVPQKSISHAKICRAYEAVGDRDAGLRACRDALGREGARADDYARYVRLLLDHPGPLTGDERAEVIEMINHLRSDQATRLGADEIQCFLGVRIQDVKMLEECVSALIAAAPHDQRTVTYHWALATARGDYDEASRLVERARRAGVKPDRISQMEETIRSGRTRRRLPMFGGAMLGMAGLAFLIIRRAPRRDRRPSPPRTGAA